MFNNLFSGITAGSVQQGTLLNQFKQFEPVITNQYYWWDNAAKGNTRIVRILHTWEDGIHGTDYTINKSTDAHYEINNIQKVDLVSRKVGAVNYGLLQWNYGIGARIDYVTFSGSYPRE